MFYLCLVIFSLCGWTLPWWAMAALAFTLGLFLPGKSAHVALAGALSWFALAFVRDGQSHGIISRRMSGLFGLPHPDLIFLVVALLGAITAGLAFRAGAAFQLRGQLPPVRQ